LTGTVAFFAWLGAAVIVLSDGRRGLALGLGLTALAFSLLVWLDGQPIGAGAILVGGGFATFQRLRSGREGWAMMPPGSTPRLVLAIAGGLVALWLATTVTTGPGAPLRFAAFAVLGLMGARVLTETEPGSVLTAVVLLALTVAVASGIADTGPGPAPYIAAAAIALGVSVLGGRSGSSPSPQPSTRRAAGGSDGA
jgi:hypothetical protein